MATASVCLPVWVLLAAGSVPWLGTNWVGEMPWTELAFVSHSRLAAVALGAILLALAMKWRLTRQVPAALAALVLGLGAPTSLRLDAPLAREGMSLSPMGPDIHMEGTLSSLIKRLSDPVDLPLGGLLLPDPAGLEVQELIAKEKVAALSEILARVGDLALDSLPPPSEPNSADIRRQIAEAQEELTRLELRPERYQDCSRRGMNSSTTGEVDGLSLIHI